MNQQCLQVLRVYGFFLARASVRFVLCSFCFFILKTCKTCKTCKSVCLLKGNFLRVCFNPVRIEKRCKDAESASRV
jgi:hypothetical protein